MSKSEQIDFKHKVMCISDSQETSRLIRLILHKHLDIECQSSELAEFSLETTCKEKPDIILLDVPYSEEIRGEVIVKEIKGATVLANTSIIALIAPRWPEYDANYPIGLYWILRECEKCIRKPFIVDELVNTICIFLGIDSGERS